MRNDANPASGAAAAETPNWTITAGGNTIMPVRIVDFPSRRNAMRTRLSVAVASVGIMLAGAPLWAHHAFAAEFDINQSVTLRGTVTKMEWTNPHSWIVMDVKGADGAVTSWAV